MILRLSDQDAAALRRYASTQGLSIQQAVQAAIRQMLHEERRARFIQHIVTEDAELVHRLAQ